MLLATVRRNFSLNIFPFSLTFNRLWVWIGFVATLYIYNQKCQFCPLFAYFAGCVQRRYSLVRLSGNGKPVTRARVLGIVTGLCGESSVKFHLIATLYVFGLLVHMHNCVPEGPPEHEAECL